MIAIEGQVQTEVKGLMTQVSGDAMLQMKGGDHDDQLMTDGARAGVRCDREARLELVTAATAAEAAAGRLRLGDEARGAARRADGLRGVPRPARRRPAVWPTPSGSWPTPCRSARRSGGPAAAAGIAAGPAAGASRGRALAPPRRGSSTRPRRTAGRPMAAAEAAAFGHVGRLRRVRRLLERREPRPAAASRPSPRRGPDRPRRRRRVDARRRPSPMPEKPPDATGRSSTSASRSPTAAEGRLVRSRADRRRRPRRPPTQAPDAWD